MFTILKILNYTKAYIWLNIKIFHKVKKVKNMRKIGTYSTLGRKYG
jgi:hypothetical protein